MKQEENLVEVQVGILSGAALNYMVAKVLGYEPWIAKGNTEKHLIRSTSGRSTNPEISYKMSMSPMGDSFDIYTDPGLVGAILFNKLYNYNEILVGHTNPVKIYTAESIDLQSNGNLIQTGGTSAAEAGFKLLVIEEMNLESITGKVEIPEYLAQLLFPGKYE